LDELSHPTDPKVLQLFLPEIKFSLLFDLHKLQLKMCFRVNQENPELQVMQGFRDCQ